MIRWIFLDVGNVLMNDDPVMAFIYDRLHAVLTEKGFGVSFEELLQERERTIRERGAGHWYFIGERYLGVDGMHRLMHACAACIRADYMRYHNVIPGMSVALEELSREYHLGILANQLREAVGGLEVSGLKRYFRVLALSELIDLKKPDPAMFRWALDRAGCSPREALMVGDRVDNDIAPARHAGMWTIWFHPPLEAKGYRPPEGRARLYFESQLRASIADLPPKTDGDRPDGEARSARELVSVVRSLRRLSEKDGA
jgi:HAD superfamily hydrolase (TIGR01549 family)